MGYTYRVEYTDDGGREHIEPYDDRLVAAKSRAKAKSETHGVAYVISLRTLAGGLTQSVGHKAFADGNVVETIGDGFGKNSRKKVGA